MHIHTHVPHTHVYEHTHTRAHTCTQTRTRHADADADAMHTHKRTPVGCLILGDLIFFANLSHAAGLIRACILILNSKSIFKFLCPMRGPDVPPYYVLVLQNKSNTHVHTHTHRPTRSHRSNLRKVKTRPYQSFGFSLTNLEIVYCRISRFVASFITRSHSSMLFLFVIVRCGVL